MYSVYIPTPQVERSLFQNFLHGKQLEYRNYPPVEMPAEESLFGGLGGGSGGGGGGSIGGGSEDRRSDAWENMSTSTKVWSSLVLMGTLGARPNHGGDLSKFELRVKR